MGNYKIKAISNILNDEIEETRKRIKEVFGYDISIHEASKVIAWKSRNYKFKLTKSALMDILKVK